MNKSASTTVIAYIFVAAHAIPGGLLGDWLDSPWLAAIATVAFMSVMSTLLENRPNG